MRLNKLGDFMKEKGIRPEDLASKTGLSIDTVRNARRKKSVSNSTVAAIERGLGTTRKELL